MSDQATGVKYEHIVQGDNDIYVVSRPTGSIQLDLTEFNATLADLVPYSRTYISKLLPAQRKLFDAIVDASRAVYDVPEVYKIVLAAIYSVFNNSKVTYTPGTVGAYLVGCAASRTAGFPGSATCSASCASALPPENYQDQDCKDPVLIYSDGQLSSLGGQSGSHSFIHVYDTNFDKFGPSHIKQLKDTGIQQVTLVYNDANSTYQESTYYGSLDDLAAALRADDSHPTVYTGGEVTNSAVYGGWLAVLVLVLVILALYLIFSYAGVWN
jgi:hypothetical protein